VELQEEESLECVPQGVKRGFSPFDPEPEEKNFDNYALRRFEELEQKRVKGRKQR